MKHLFLFAGLFLIGFTTGCSSSESPTILNTAAQIDALTKDFDTWYRYTHYRVLLARDFQARGVNGRPLPKKAFLQQLATGRVLALRNGIDHKLPVYQLFAYPQGHDPAIRATSKQLADEALRNCTWEGKTLPTFKWRDLNGTTYTSANTRGKTLVIKCWYTSCVACVDEFAAIDTLVDRYRQHPRVLVVSLAMNKAKILRAFLKDRAVKFAVIPTEKSYLADTLGVFEYPTHFIINPNGKIVKVTNRASDLAVALAKEVPLARH